MAILETERLILRQWRNEDKADFFSLNSDPEVMRYFPSTLNREQSDALLEKARTLIEKNGWGFWACELKSSSELIGFVGLNNPDYELPFGPCTEIGWRLAKQHWKKGYATEAAMASLDFGFSELKLTEIVSFAVKTNTPSITVMERIGMSNSNSNFDHPKVDVAELREHVLYKVRNTGFGA